VIYPAVNELTKITLKAWRSVLQFVIKGIHWFVI